jgi:hypothetical protein
MTVHLTDLELASPVPLALSDQSANLFGALANTLSGGRVLNRSLGARKPWGISVHCKRQGLNLLNAAILLGSRFVLESNSLTSATTLAIAQFAQPALIHLIETKSAPASGNGLVANLSARTSTNSTRR